MRKAAPIVGKTHNGMFVYFGPPEPSKEELARRWFNYGFNDYVEGRYSRSLYDYRRYEIESKVADERGRWIRAWMEYGYTLGILYYECFHPDLEPRCNAFRQDAELLDFINLDYSKLPPGVHDGLELWELDKVAYVYHLVRVKMGEDTHYKTVDCWHSGGKYRDVMDILVKLDYPENYELISFNYWKLGAKK